MSQVNECIWQVSQVGRGKPDHVGDEEPRSGGIAVMDDASGGVEVGDARPVVDPPVGAEPSDEDHGAAEPDGDEPVAVDGVVPPDGGESPDAPNAEAVDAGPQEEAEGDPVAEAADVPAPRRRSSLRRGVVVGALALVVALAVSAFATSGSGGGGDVDQRFLDATRSQGLVVAGGEQQTLLVSAARKICERRESHETAAQRRATALSIEELGSVSQTFGDDARSFTSLALKTYCPN